MRQIFLLILLLLPVTSMAAENLIENLSTYQQNTTITDGVVHQINADEGGLGLWKAQAIYNNNNHIYWQPNLSFEQLWQFYDYRIGFISHTFSTPDDLEDLQYFRFGLNGQVRDTLVTFDIKDVMPNTTYTLQWRVLNNTQGEIAWTDMLVVHCGDGYSLALGEENCSRTCADETVPGGHIPPDVARVYEPAVCTYTSSNLVCDDGYAKVDNACEQICTAGISHLRAGDLSRTLYARKIGSPALHVRYNNSICYGRLATGRGTGLNINMNGTIYHLID